MIQLVEKEIIDFFNEKGEYILTAPLETKHKKNRHLYIRGVYVFIINNKKEILIQRKREDHTKLNRWEIPSGHVNSGEAYEAAARRELKEETGVVTPLAYIKTSKTKKPNEFDAFYLGYSNFLPNPENNPEVDAFEFITFNNLIKEIRRNTRLFAPKLIKFLETNEEEFRLILKEKKISFGTKREGKA